MIDRPRTVGMAHERLQLKGLVSEGPETSPPGILAPSFLRHSVPKTGRPRVRLRKYQG